jgi:hypothetical protein
MRVPIVKIFRVPTVTLISILFGAFAQFEMTACGPMNHQSNSGQGSATVDAGTEDTAKDLVSKNNTYLVSVRFQGAHLKEGQALPEGNDVIQVRAAHSDLTPLASTETINVQYYKSKVDASNPEVPPNQGANQAVLQTEADGSINATLNFTKPSKVTMIMITITNSAEPSLSDKKYVKLSVN